MKDHEFYLASVILGSASGDLRTVLSNLITQINPMWVFLKYRITNLEFYIQ